MTPNEPPLNKIKQAILAPEVSFSDGIGRFRCDDRFAITLDDWLILIAHQSFHFSQSHHANHWKASVKTGLSSDSVSLYEIFSGDGVVAWAAKRANSKPVVKLLHQGGEPPDIIQKDWRKQLAKIGKPNANVCLALCNPDGILALIPEWARESSSSNQKENDVSDSIMLTKTAFDGFASWTEIRWPWQSSLHSPKTVTTVDLNPSTDSDLVKVVSTTPREVVFAPKVLNPGIGGHVPSSGSVGTPVGIAIKPKLKSGAAVSQPNTKSKGSSANRRFLVMISGGIGLVLIVSALIWSSLATSNSSNSSISASRTDVARASVDAISEQPIQPKSEQDQEPIETLDVANDLDMQELATDDALTSIDSLTSELESFAGLEGQLNDKVFLNELDTSNIIARSLNREAADVKPVESKTENNDLSGGSAKGMEMPDLLNSDPITDVKADSEGVSEPLDDAVAVTNTIRKDVLTVASKKEKVNFGFSVVPKDAAWSAQLLVEDGGPKSLVFSPGELTQSTGPGKVTWVLGLEDEDPELIVEIVVKPGRRWEIVWQVGFRESRDMTPRLLGPNDAAIVLSQLVSAKTFVGRMLTQNQAARDARVRGPVDLFEQRRELQRQDREWEQAIERWKVIESLSRVVYGKTQVEFQAIQPVVPEE